MNGDEGATDCYVCRKHRGVIRVPGGAVYEDERVYAGHGALDEGTGTAYLGWLLVEPKRHASGLADVTDDEAEALGLLITRLSRALRASERAEHVYSFVLGDHIPHLHVHVIPRYPGAPLEYRGVRVDEWPDAPRGGTAEVEAVCGRIRDALARESAVTRSA